MRNSVLQLPYYPKCFDSWDFKIILSFQNSSPYKIFETESERTWVDGAELK